MQTAQEVESLVCFFSLHSRAGFNFIFHRNVAFYERNRIGGGEKSSGTNRRESERMIKNAYNFSDVVLQLDTDKVPRILLCNKDDV